MSSYAFPIPHDAAKNGDTGMTLRDYFAGQALVAFIQQDSEKTWQYGFVAEQAYNYADAMIEARGEQND